MFNVVWMVLIKLNTHVVRMVFVKLFTFLAIVLVEMMEILVMRLMMMSDNGDKDVGDGEVNYTMMTDD